MTMDRLIGDVMEINGDILMQEQNSKLPKFLARIRSRYYRSKLIKSAKKLRKANVPLTYDNLRELFNYMISNYPPEGSYKNIKKVKIYTASEIDYMDAWVELDNLKFLIKFNSTAEVRGKFDVTISHTVSETLTETFEIMLSKLETTKPELRDIIRELNNTLYNVIADYIIETISSYNKRR